MPWEMRTVEKQREAFVEAVSSGKKSIAAVCREFGISRKTGYKWIKRAAEGQRLCDQSRWPHRQPSKTAPEMEAAVLAVRAENPAWGGRTRNNSPMDRLFFHLCFTFSSVASREYEVIR